MVLAAPAALVVAAFAPQGWLLLPVAGLALLVLVALDGWMAGPMRDVRLVVPGDAEIGRPVTIPVLAEKGGGSGPRAAIGFDPRLGIDGAAECRLARDEADDVWHGSFTLVPQRRGTGTVETLWIGWRGPLGLARRQVRREVGEEMRVWPDLSPVRSPVLQHYLRDAMTGMVARRIRGEGTQFEALSEFQPGMDRRQIDWKASARHTGLLARENEAERDNQIVFALDCGAAMSEPIDGLPRIDRAVSAALTSAYVALHGGDRVALFGFAERPGPLSPFAQGTRAFPQLQQAAAVLDYSGREPNFTLALATLATTLKRRSLVVIVSDFTDPTSAELMIESVERLVRRHLVLFVTMEDAELASLSSAAPDSVGDVAAAVSADALARQRALVLERLRHLGVDVIEAPWETLTYQLIDRYLATKHAEAIG
ncbi:DUF58 domain-containing protein [Altererythrobacter salegens]|uniref:DUF58 domain-containing protein n=1 Tax=Croceibacterium salegens TaxID=1737568 RepID=A0A6I4SZ11_9SPHN|nr:DUF58 domain-containing protein [Croceibacterium salegens]